MFKVAVCNVSGTKKQRKWTHEDIADLDIKTSKNLIGDIINCSQELNTLIWHKLAKGSTYEDIEDIYLDVCKLSILSNLEIDKAKKEFVIDSWKELDLIRRKYKQVNDDDKTIKPNFFAHISRQKGFYNPEKKEYKKFKTSMDYLQACVNKFNNLRTYASEKTEFLPFSSVVEQKKFNYDKVYDKVVYEILSGVENINNCRLAIYQNNNLTSDEKYQQFSEIRQDFINNVGQWDFNQDTMIALLKSIEKEENKKYYSLIFYTLFGYPNTSFYNVIKNSSEEITSIQPDEDGNITIYGRRFKEYLT